VPKLWTETVEGHRREVRRAILDGVAALVAEHGPRAVTMSQIAEQAGIGRATLYKYFPDLEAILAAWHDESARAHLEHLAAIARGTGDPAERLAHVLRAYAHVARELGGYAERHGRTWRVVHTAERIAHAQERLHALIRDVLVDAAAAGAVRDDLPPDELTTYCLHAVGAAATARRPAAVEAIVAMTLAGLRWGVAGS
jgi:AcrR family transcriptional regulator